MHVRGLVRLLNNLRRQHGLPHKILLDEVHYFLSDALEPDLVDPLLSGYILVTYRSSMLAPAVSEMPGTIAIALRETDPAEIASVAAGYQGRAGLDAFRDLLAGLQPNEAALLPGPDEARGQVRRFALAPRITEHVRHRLRYLDMPVSDAQAFQFSGPGPIEGRARSLREFTAIVSSMPAYQLDGYLARHDFSRWLEDVFRDRTLAVRVRGIEDTRYTIDARDLAAAIAQAIRARYETAPGVPRR